MRGDKAELAKRQAEDDIITKEAVDQKAESGSGGIGTVYPDVPRSLR